MDAADDRNQEPPGGSYTQPGRDLSIAGGASKRALSERVNYWSTVISAIAAAAALILSGYTFLQLNTRPEMMISLPRVVELRYNHGTSLGTSLDLIIQPSFYVYEKTDVVSLVSDLKLEMREPTSLGGTRPFTWYQNVKYDFPAAPANVENSPTDVETEAPLQVSPRWDADPGPVVVLQDSPQSPAVLFTTYNLQGLQPGIWDMVLTIERLKQTPITINFCVDLSADDFQALHPAEAGPGETYSRYFRNTSSFTVTGESGESSECYSSANN